LDVYDTKEGLWNPDHGELELPADWELLPAGDTFVTKRVKAAGVYWTAWLPRSRSRAHRRKLGVFAPTAVISQARVDAEVTEERRARQRVSNARHRDKVEGAYRSEFTAAVLAWLDFAPEHTELAVEIAEAAATRAVEVGSGRVGRTKQFPLEERAALAARATIRHRFTDYEDHLVELDPFESDVDDYAYRLAKKAAHEAVDDFLCGHRRPTDDA
jgi:hypothetical protein